MNAASAPAPITTDAELKLLQALIYRECGMHFDARREHFLQNRLQRRLKECQIESFYSYYRLLTSPEGRDELALLLERLTVNETSFFRNRAQLDLFSELLAQRLREKAARRDFSLRLWSAGCSTGQEPYTMAMLVGDALAYFQMRTPQLAGASGATPVSGGSCVPDPWRVEIIASDINYTVLRTAQTGAYNEGQMTPVDYAYRLRYFDKMGDHYVVRKRLKDLVHFDFHNLKTEFVPRRCDFIFCRNAMMYFDEAEQKRVVNKFSRCLTPGGHLFVGHAESLLGLTDKFVMVHRNQGTAYQHAEVSE